MTKKKDYASFEIIIDDLIDAMRQLVEIADDRLVKICIEPDSVWVRAVDIFNVTMIQVEITPDVFISPPTERVDYAIYPFEIIKPLKVLPKAATVTMEFYRVPSKLSEEHEFMVSVLNISCASKEVSIDELMLLPDLSSIAGRDPVFSNLRLSAFASPNLGTLKRIIKRFGEDPIYLSAYNNTASDSTSDSTLVLSDSDPRKSPPDSMKSKRRFAMGPMPLADSHICTTCMGPENLLAALKYAKKATIGIENDFPLRITFAGNSITTKLLIAPRIDLE